jgi:tRNA U38,U39,U40 pseudouridine synthase TruA
MKITFKIKSCAKGTALRRRWAVGDTSPRRLIERFEDEVRIDVVANAFLHHMVRNIAGLLIEVGSGLAQPEFAAELLAGRDRRRAPPTAPPDGLYLRAVHYPAAFDLPDTVPVEPPSRSAMIPAH